MPVLVGLKPDAYSYLRTRLSDGLLDKQSRRRVRLRILGACEHAIAEARAHIEPTSIARMRLVRFAAAKRSCRFLRIPALSVVHSILVLLSKTGVQSFLFMAALAGAPGLIPLLWIGS